MGLRLEQMQELIWAQGGGFFFPQYAAIRLFVLHNTTDGDQSHDLHAIRYS